MIILLSCSGLTLAGLVAVEPLSAALFTAFGMALRATARAARNALL